MIKDIIRELERLASLPYEGPPFEIVPKGRTKQDVIAYRFLHWFGRKHKKEIEELIFNHMMERYIYGMHGGIYNKASRPMGIGITELGILND